MALRDEAEQLRKRISELESALAEVREQKEAIERRKDDFIAILGHELRNPLAAIQSGLDLWVSASPERTAWIRQVLTRQTEQLARIVDDLLDVSRLNRGKVTLRLQTVELSEIVAGALVSVNDLLDERRHILEVSVPDGILLKADPARLEQILVNLLTNAARYTDEGGHICLLAEDRGDQVRIEVQDNGIGLSAGRLSSIFDLLPQTGGPQNQARGGLGIGLNLVRQLVEMHQGTISAASEGPGRGSTFTVVLPVGAIDREPAPVFDSPQVSKISSHPRRVLVVDDNQDLAISLSYLLSQSGHTVQTAFDGTSALRLAEAFRPDVTLLDVSLPDLDGTIAAERLRALEAESAHRMTIIGVSGFGVVRRSQNQGRRLFDHYLVKPVSLQLLHSLIEASARRDVLCPKSEDAGHERRPDVSELAQQSAAASRRMLIIDDSKAVADLTQELLEAEGYQTAVAYDGRRGLELVPEFKPDVILCDLNLAGPLSGWEVATAVREVQADRAPVLVALTAWGGDEIRHALKRSAFDFHLSKPLDIKELERLIATTA